MTYPLVWHHASRRIFLLSLLLGCEPVSATEPQDVGSTTASSAQASQKRLVLKLVQGRDLAPQPIEIVKGLILFQGRLNGRPVTILLDNGTGRTVVDTTYARRAGIPIGEPVGDALTGSGRIASFRTGRTDLEVPGAFTMSGELVSFDLRPMSRAIGRQIDAVLGGDATGLISVMIQPDKKRLTLVSSGSIKLDGPDVVRFPILAGNQVEATVNGQKVRLLIDLGYSGAIMLSDAAWHRVVGRTGISFAGPDGIMADGTTNKSRVATAALNIGPISSQDVPIASGYVPVGITDGLLGTGFFLKGTSVIDGPANNVTLIVPRSSQPAPMTPAR